MSNGKAKLFIKKIKIWRRSMFLLVVILTFFVAILGVALICETRAFNEQQRISIELEKVNKILHRRVANLAKELRYTNLRIEQKEQRIQEKLYENNLIIEELEAENRKLKVALKHETMQNSVENQVKTEEKVG